MKKNVLNLRILNVKTPTYISRVPRSLEDIKLFKSSEYRSFLLYLLPVFLNNLLPQKYLLHFRLLSSSIYTLLQPSISSNDLNETKEKLRNFVSCYEKHYGKIAMTMNVHSLLHLVDCVIHFGPLWCFSMFPFESYNGLLKSFVVAPTDVLYQITTRYIGYKTESKNEHESKSVHTFLNEIEVMFGPHYVMAFEGAGLFDLNNVKFFSRFNKNGDKFTSKRYKKAKKHCDYFITMDNQTMGVIEFFFIVDFNQYALIELLECSETIDQVKKVNFTEKYLCVSANEIVDKCVYMENLKESFVVKRPNSFERN